MAAPNKRPRQTMPAHVRRALQTSGQTSAYAARPSYQRNDYLRWIADAAQPATKEKRLQQMLSELRAGGTYMGMAHAKSAKRAKPAAPKRGR